MTKLRRPCNNCPWRVDAPRQYWDPQHFLDIWKNCQDDGVNLMMCHKTNDQTEAQRKANQLICQGWARVQGFDAIGVRLALIKGEVTVQEVEDRKGPKLFKTFEAMMRANKIPIPARNRFVPDHLVKPRAKMGTR